ncbi:MAG TPA: DUF1569 domain-containing protein [Terriglobales bacterium]|jgi:hypothetical protein|nr:DUF1569 domain-containing protein [Terriglobales bacterium]
MHPELETIRRAIERATVGMNITELDWRPKGKWSSAEVLQHLALTYSGTAKGMRRVLENGDAKLRRATWKERFFITLVVGVGYFPYGRVAPEQVTPRQSNPEQVLETIYANLSEMDESIGACEKRFGSKAVVLLHPVLGPLSLKQWRKFHRVHCLHHMRQIRNTRVRIQEEWARARFEAVAENAPAAADSKGSHGTGGGAALHESLKDEET